MKDVNWGCKSIRQKMLGKTDKIQKICDRNAKLMWKTL